MSPGNVAGAEKQPARATMARADHSLECQATTDGPLERDAEFDINARVHWIAQVINAVNVDDVNVLRVEPVAWPRANKSERIATVFEAVITVIPLVHTKRVSLPKVGLVTVVGNAVATGALRLLFRLSLGCALLLLLCVLFLRLGILFFWLRRLFWL